MDGNLNLNLNINSLEAAKLRVTLGQAHKPDILFLKPSDYDG